MSKLFNARQLNVNSQDGDNSSLTDWFDQDGDQSSFDSFDQIGADSLYSTPMVYGVAAGALGRFGWGAGSIRSPGLASTFSASPSASAASGSSPGGSAAFGSSARGSAASEAQEATLSTIVSFNGADGSLHNVFSGNLIIDANGDLFGTTSNGGANGAGTVFEIAKTSAGYASTPTTLVSFNGSDGAGPDAELIVDANGDLFGTTYFGGADDDGSVFEIAKTSTGYASAPTTLVSFNGSDGKWPNAGLIADANGDLFGTTVSGGAYGYGTVFEIAKTSTGYASAPTTLVSFNDSDGEFPYAGLIADAQGDLFGTTEHGGAYDAGTVFEIAKTSAGYVSAPTTLVNFNWSDGSSPFSSLIADAQGDLFGTTSGGGVNGDGTVFEIAKTLAGYASAPTTLVNFSGSDGESPTGSLIADAQGDLFGTTQRAGANNDGTVFEIAKTSTGYASAPTTLVSFNGSDGANPYSGLAADANGDLFGMTIGGGANDLGAVFEVTGSGFVTTAPPSLPEPVLFEGQDSSGQANIWETDGTAAGTVELPGIAGASPNGLFPLEFTAYNGEVLFTGLDASVDRNLWVTNGTAFGTYELTGIAGASSLGLSPSSFFVYNGLVYFDGSVPSGGLLPNQSLWVTNGTAAGTKPIPITGLQQSPFNYILILGATNGEMLFSAEDTSNYAGLWVYNGTTASELIGIAGASPNGLAPNNSTEYKCDVWFGGNDNTGNNGLWSTDGTVVGTKELTGIAGASTKGFDPNNLAVYNGELLFEGVDSEGNEALWISNGTSAGTHELSIIGENWEGSFPVPLNPLAVYDGEAYFNAVDPNNPNLHDLWVTNGTVSGTHVVTGIVGADPSGSGLNPSNLTAYDGLLLFSGTDSAGNVGLWAYNGAEGSELPISGAASTGVDPYGLYSIVGPTNPGLTYENLGLVNTSWQIAGTGDFNGVGEDGILWRNTNGDVQLWNSNGSGGFTYQNLGVVNTSWQIVGTEDFNCEGIILWRNTMNGDVESWTSNGSGGFTYQNLGAVNTSWQIAGTGDFNGEDGILWRNTNGDVELWNSNGWGSLGTGGFTYENLGVVNTNWQIEGIGDFNNVGEDGILWRSTTNGDVELWNSNGSGGFTYENLGDVNTSWQIEGVGDFNGPGDEGIRWRNTNGDVELWNSNGWGGFTYQNLGDVNTSWQIQGTNDFGTGDFTGNGQDGALWRNTNGGVELWNPK